MSGEPLHTGQSSAIQLGSNMLKSILVIFAVVQSLVDPAFADLYMEEARAILSDVPLVDGHNDLPWRLMYAADGDLTKVDLTQNMSGQFYRQEVLFPSHTDIPRLRQGMLGAQFWSIFTFCDSEYKDGVGKALEVIDMMYRLIDKYNETFMFVSTAQGILDAKQQGKVGSMFGMEGGHMIGESMAVLRMLYRMGVRYLTLTWNCNTAWSDANQAEKDKLTPKHGGLTDWGKELVLEMNRMGMLVDLSHVSADVMRDVLTLTRAPVMFSHSSVYHICPHPRNVPDDVINRVKENGGIIMVNFYNYFVNCTLENHLGYSTPRPATMDQVIDHMEYIRDTIGPDHVGIGGDFDGVEVTPTGLEDVTTYVNLVARMLARGWQEDHVKKAVGLNIIRVFSEVEEVRDNLTGEEANSRRIPEADVPDTSCKSPPLSVFTPPGNVSQGHSPTSAAVKIAVTLAVIFTIVMFT